MGDKVEVNERGGKKTFRGFGKRPQIINGGGGGGGGLAQKGVQSQLNAMEVKT